MQSRPSLAVLNEDYLKLRNVESIEDIDGLINYLITILNIKVSSQEEANDLKIQMLVVSDFLKSKFGYLTIPEIKEAFKMYVAREFPEIKVFRILDCPSIGEVLKSYTEFRNESLRIYEQKKKLINSPPQIVSMEDKKKIRDSFIDLVFEELQTSEYYDSAWLLYDDLYLSGKIKITDEEKINLYKAEYQKYLSEKRVQISKKGGVFSTLLKNELTELSKNMNNIKIVQNRCKSILVCGILKPKSKEGIQKFKDFIYE